VRYHVRAKLKPDRATALKGAIDHGTLGRGSVAGSEYLRDMTQARWMPDGTTHWVEVCFCATPLEEERPYWEAYFELLEITDATDRSACKHESGREPWACVDCHCARKLERALGRQGTPFLGSLEHDRLSGDGAG
jgi:hypothetical protein